MARRAPEILKFLRAQHVLFSCVLHLIVIEIVKAKNQLDRVPVWKCGVNEPEKIEDADTCVSWADLFRFSCPAGQAVRFKGRYN